MEMVWIPEASPDNPPFTAGQNHSQTQPGVGWPRVHQTQKMPPVAAHSVLALNQNPLCRDTRHYLLCKV